MIVFAVSILNGLVTTHKHIVKFNQDSLASCIGKVDVVISLFPFLGQMIHNIKYGKAKISLTGAIRTIDNAILNNVIFYGICAEIIIAVPG